MTIKEQKLSLYKEYVAKCDRTHLSVRMGYTGDVLEQKVAALAQKYAKITEVPKGYSLKELQRLVALIKVM